VVASSHRFVASIANAHSEKLEPSPPIAELPINHSSTSEYLRLRLPVVTRSIAVMMVWSNRCLAFAAPRHLRIRPENASRRCDLAT
jgi:hypothetical protein